MVRGVDVGLVTVRVVGGGRDTTRGGADRTTARGGGGGGFFGGGAACAAVTNATDATASATKTVSRAADLPTDLAFNSASPGTMLFPKLVFLRLIARCRACRASLHGVPAGDDNLHDVPPWRRIPGAEGRGRVFTRVASTLSGGTTP